MSDRPFTVAFGTPITNDQAIRAILSRIHSPIVGDMSKERPRYSLERLSTDPIHSMLSGGEKALVALAISLEMQENPLGGMDEANRRWCLHILAYRYLGHEIFNAFTVPEWESAFGTTPDPKDVEQ